MLTGIILISLLASFLIMLADKTGLVGYMQLHGSKLMAKLFSCQFCLSFWVCFALSVLLMADANDFFATVKSLRDANLLPLLYPIFCTPITRILL